MTKKVILAEGPDEKSFFSALCDKKELGDFEFVTAGGKTNIKSQLLLLKNRKDFKEISTLILVQDADESHASTVQSLTNVLARTELPAPTNQLEYAENAAGDIKVGFYVMPGDGDPGMLEDLLLKSVEGSPVKEQAEIYINKLIELGEEGLLTPPRNISKAKLYAYLSGMEKHKPNLWLAIQAGQFELDSEQMKPLTDFLVNA